MEQRELADMVGDLSAVGFRPIVVGTCYGAQDEHGLPICDGPDPQQVRAKESPDGEEFTTTWCAPCQAMARYLGYTILKVGV